MEVSVILHSLSQCWRKAAPRGAAVAAGMADLSRSAWSWGSGRVAAVAGAFSNLLLLSRHKAGELRWPASRLPLHLHDPHSAFLPHGAHDWEYSSSKTLSLQGFTAALSSSTKCLHNFYRPYVWAGPYNDKCKWLLNSQENQCKPLRNIMVHWSLVFQLNH